LHGPVGFSLLAQKIAAIVNELDEMPQKSKLDAQIQKAAKIIQAQLDMLPLGLAKMKRRELGRIAQFAYRTTLSKRPARLR